MVMLYKSTMQVRTRYRRKKIGYQGKKNAKSMQVSVAMTNQTPSHSPYSDKIATVSLRGEGVSCVLAMTVLPSPTSAVLSTIH